MYGDTWCIIICKSTQYNVEHASMTFKNVDPVLSYIMSAVQAQIRMVHTLEQHQSYYVVQLGSYNAITYIRV